METQRVIRLWTGAAPGAAGNEPKDIPTLTLYPPAGGDGPAPAMVICPGGGYEGLAPHEGEPIARWLNGMGLFCAVLTYRLGPRYRHPIMLTDVSRAMRTLRARSGAWSIDPARIGVMGSSAGGHLASTLCTHFDGGNAEASDEIERVSCRPDLAILLYPVINIIGPSAHSGSRQNLLGKAADEALLRALSNDLQVTAQTPPAFLFHTADDPVVPVQNSVLYAMALRRCGVPFALHVFEHGAHGVGLAGDDPVLRQWTTLCEAWLRGRGFASDRR